MKPGTIVIFDASMTLAPSGTLAEPAGPTDVIRLSVTTISPSGMISSARMVMTLAPLSTIVPRGRLLGRSITTASSSGLGFCSLLFGGGLVFVFAFFSVFALERIEDDRIERQAEEARADGPRDRLAAVGPAGVVGPDIGELLDGNGRLVHRDLGWLAAETGQRDQIKLVGDDASAHRPSGRTMMSSALSGMFGE